MNLLAGQNQSCSFSLSSQSVPPVTSTDGGREKRQFHVHVGDVEGAIHIPYLCPSGPLTLLLRLRLIGSKGFLGVSSAPAPGSAFGIPQLDCLVQVVDEEAQFSCFKISKAKPKGLLRFAIA
jgi:hypothetical protein